MHQPEAGECIGEVRRAWHGGVEWIGEETVKNESTASTGVMQRKLLRGGESRF